MFIPAFFSGIILPYFISASNAWAGRIHKTTGLFYGTNTLGCVFGAVLAGLMLIPHFGTEVSLIWGGIFFAASALCALITVPNGPVPQKPSHPETSPSSFSLSATTALADPPWWFGGQSSAYPRPLVYHLQGWVKTAIAAGFIAAFFAAVFLRQTWDPYILSSGAFIYRPYRQFANFSGFKDNFHKTSKLIYYDEGISAGISVLAHGNEIYLKINGKTDASLQGDIATQLLLAHIPYSAHPGNPENALVIGLGSGISAGALSVYENIKKIDCAEIEPSVAHAAGFFAKRNRGILTNPKFEVFFIDARQYLLANRKKYDIIISEPSNPWIAGVASLYTKEAFALAKSRLSGNGIYCQWVHAYSMGKEDFRMIMNTFASVFGNVMLMRCDTSDFLILGSNTPITLNYAMVSENFKSNAELKKDMASLKFFTAFQFLDSAFMLNDADFRKFSAGSAINTDDNSALEYSAPKYLNKGEENAIFSGISSARSNQLNTVLRGIEDKEYQKLKREKLLKITLSGLGL